MTANALLQNLTWLIFGIIFVRVVRDAIQQPTRTTIDIALFFGAPTLVSLLTALVRLQLVVPSRGLTLLTGALVLSLSYLVVRLVADFVPTHSWVLGLAASMVLIASASLVVIAPPLPVWTTILIIGVFVGFQFYAASAFYRAMQRSTGVTQRRMQAVTMGSSFLGGVLLAAGVQRSIPEGALLVQVLSLLAAISYFVGFAPPDVLRRAWQEPELRAFLGRAATLPRLPTTQAILAEIASGAARSLGVRQATVGLWDPEAQLLRFPLDPNIPHYPLTADIPALQAFRTQQAHFTPAFVDPFLPSSPTSHQPYAVIAAPITAGDQRLGVLVAYTRTAPIFASEDTALLHLLADQAAVILESRALIDEAARVQAREQATRLKDDFLSAAAHDLKTPLTTLVARSQLLERRIIRSPTTPIDLASVQTLVQEAQRLKRLVQELLDAGRAEQGQLVGTRHRADLVPLAAAVRSRHDSPRHPCTLDAPTAMMAMIDPHRIEQLLENLVENAVKYSPTGGAIQIRLWETATTIEIMIADQGIGIPAADRPRIFERFHRGSNVDDRRFAGMGLGLYLCQAIVQQHGGTITVTDTIPQGTTVSIQLPRESEGALSHESAHLSD